jgi:hypothetical protein
MLARRFARMHAPIRYAIHPAIQAYIRIARQLRGFAHDEDMPQSERDFKDEILPFELHVNDKMGGGLSLGHRFGDNRVAERMFPGVIQPGQSVARIHGIDIDRRLQGAGLGQLLYLHGLIHHGADWLYNSQTEPPATNALKALHAKGLINLHWSPRVPGYDQGGGVHLVGATEAGRDAYEGGSVVKQHMLPPIPHILGAS